MTLEMTAFRLIPFQLHGGLEMFTGLFLLAAPFLFGFGVPATVVALLAGVLVVGAAFGVAAAEPPPPPPVDRLAPRLRPRDRDRPLRRRGRARRRRVGHGRRRRPARRRHDALRALPHDALQPSRLTSLRSSIT
jgi:hypothetical protein